MRSLRFQKVGKLLMLFLGGLILTFIILFITDSTIKKPVVTQEVESNSKKGYEIEEEIIVNKPIKVQKNKNNLLLASEESTKFTPNAANNLTVTEGTVYLYPQELAYTVNSPESNFEMEADSIVVLNIIEQIYYVIRGKVILEDGQVISGGQKIDFKIDENNVISIDRNDYSSNEYLSKILSLLEQLDDLPVELLDFTGPVIEGLNVNTGFITTDENIFIQGTTEPDATVLINNRSAIVKEDGTFQLEISIKLGENQLKIVSTDMVGNNTVLELVVNRTAPSPEQQSQAQSLPQAGGGNVSTSAPSQQAEPVTSPTTQVNTSSQCNSDFSVAIINLINNYRQSSGKGVLSSEGALNTASCKHSNWMSANTSFSHTGANGSLPWDRCAAEGSSCNAENIALAGSPTADVIFQQWVNSPDHNANLLGNYTVIGVGMFNGYVTAVFR